MTLPLSLGAIGGADGPTAIFVSGSFGWLHLLGIIAAAGLLVPNLIWAARHKTPKDNTDVYRKESRCTQLMELLERIGRWGCIFFAVVCPGSGFRNVGSMLLCVLGGAVLLCCYWVLWLIWAKQQLVWQGLALCILPCSLFLLLALTTCNAPLLFFAALFAVGHLYMSGFYIR